MRAAILGLLFAVASCALEFDESKLLDAGPIVEEDGGGTTTDLSCDCQTGRCRNPCNSAGTIDGSCSCDASCGGGSCAIDCSDDSVCGISCNGGECDVTAQNATSVTAVCRDGADCAFSCSDAARCDAIRCEGATCIIDCSGAAVCGFSFCTDGQAECPDGQIVCGRECP